MMLYLVLAQVLSANESMTLATPEPVAFPHFPTPLHAFVWRNWQLVPAARMAEVVGASVEEIVALGGRMGLSGPPDITEDQQRRSYVTVIRRNWHLLPLEQMQALLGWTRQHLEYILREDDFLFIKLGILKPRCAPLRFVEATAQTREREQQIARWAAESFPQGVGLWEEPLFQFVNDLSAPAPELPAHNKGNFLSPRFCYSYFAPYGDPLLNPELDPYPDGLLARLANVGVNGVWLQAVLYTLAPFPWEPERSEGYEKRLASLRHLVERAKKHGIGVYLYLNEPRAMPLSFFEEHPELKGAVDVREKTHASLCTSVPEVRDYMRNAVAAVCREVPDIAGFFTITFSENWTHCWAHSHETKQAASGCPRCAKRAPEEVIAEVNATIYNGVKDAESSAQVIVWDWVWPSEWIPGIIERLPEGVKVMSVSEWDKPITVGGVQSVCGEYSLSVVGPGPRALRTWDLARRRGLQTLAKVQASNTWEISSVPYIPVVENAARHATNLREAAVDGFMESWTLGGYPSPGLEVFNAMVDTPGLGMEQAMRDVAERRFGPRLAPHALRAWKAFSRAFTAFPFDRALLYSAPLQTGPANPLWEQPTGYRSTMVGYPYDDLDAWCSIFPPEKFIEQLESVADGFDLAIDECRRNTNELDVEERWASALAREMGVAEACAIHCRSSANQAAFIVARRQLAETNDPDRIEALKESLRRALESEISLSVRLYAIQTRDSRIGFEASNQYMYVPTDLAEKVLNCRDLLDRWLPALSAR